MRIVRHQRRRLVNIPPRIRLGKGECQRYCAREKGTRCRCAECSDWSAMGRLPATMDSGRHGSIRFNRVEDASTYVDLATQLASCIYGWLGVANHRAICAR